VEGKFRIYNNQLTEDPPFPIKKINLLYLKYISKHMGSLVKLLNFQCRTCVYVHVCCRLGCMWHPSVCVCVCVWAVCVHGDGEGSFSCTFAL
jgi:hypothetical protein